MSGLVQPGESDAPIRLDATRARGRASAKDESGFTLIEVMVAMALLLVGVFATFAILDTSNQAAAQNVSRDGATNVARELLDRAASVSYNDLTPDVMPATSQTGTCAAAATSAGAACALQAVTADSTAAPVRSIASPAPDGSVCSDRRDARCIWWKWPILRGGRTYTVQLNACRMPGAGVAVPVIDWTYCAAAASSSGQPALVTAATGTSSCPTIGLGTSVILLPDINLCLAALPLVGGLLPIVCQGLGNSSLLGGVLASGGVVSTVLQPLAGLYANICPPANGTPNTASLGLGQDSTVVTAIVSWTSGGHTSTIRQSTSVLNPQADSGQGVSGTPGSGAS